MTLELVADIGLAGLTAVTIAYCLLLDRRLRTLRAGESELETLVRGLTEATEKADRTLAAYRLLGDDRSRRLDALMGEARALADELQFLTQRAPVTERSARGAPSLSVVEGELAEVLRAAR